MTVVASPISRPPSLFIFSRLRCPHAAASAACRFNSSRPDNLNELDLRKHNTAAAITLSSEIVKWRRMTRMSPKHVITEVVVNEKDDEDDDDEEYSAGSDTSKTLTPPVVVGAEFHGKRLAKVLTLLFPGLFPSKGAATASATRGDFRRVLSEKEHEQTSSQPSSSSSSASASSSLHSSEMSADSNEEVLEPARILQQGYIIRYVPSAPPPPDYRKQGVEVLFEDGHIAVLWKPPAIVAKNRAESVGLSAAFPGLLQPSTEPDALRDAVPYQSLPRSIGGIMVLGKTRAAVDALGCGLPLDIWRNPPLLPAGLIRIESRYRAICHGSAPPQFPSEAGPCEVIQRSRSNASSWLSTIDVTLHAPEGKKGVCQALSEAGFPVVGNSQFCRYRDKGLFLALVFVRFPHPASPDRMMEFSREEPSKFASLRNREDSFWKLKSTEMQEKLQEAGMELSVDEIQKPLAYVLGYADFCGLRFTVNEQVLIPRKSSEALVSAFQHLVSEHHLSSNNLRLLDLGTGSGCVLISCLHRVSRTVGVGIDISDQALDVAKRNSAALGSDLAARCAFSLGDFNKLHESQWELLRQCDVLQGSMDVHEASLVSSRLTSTSTSISASVDTSTPSTVSASASSANPFDFILCNPPYFPTTNRPSLKRTKVADYEPAVALFSGGATGLEAYAAIASSLEACGESLLSPSGFLILEIGSGLFADVVARYAAWHVAHVELDAQGNKRAVAFSPPWRKQNLDAVG